MNVLRVNDVAELLDCTPETVRGLARDGTLPGFKPGRDWVFPAGALLRRLDEIALEQAERRREPKQPADVLHQAPARKRRALPVLPVLPDGLKG